MKEIIVGDDTWTRTDGRATWRDTRRRPPPASRTSHHASSPVARRGPRRTPHALASAACVFNVPHTQPRARRVRRHVPCTCDVCICGGTPQSIACRPRATSHSDPDRTTDPRPTKLRTRSLNPSLSVSLPQPIPQSQSTVPAQPHRLGLTSPCLASCAPPAHCTSQSLAQADAYSTR